VVAGLGAHLGWGGEADDAGAWLGGLCLTCGWEGSSMVPSVSKGGGDGAGGWWRSMSGLRGALLASMLLSCMWRLVRG
jgi:hypothetical protein